MELSLLQIALHTSFTDTNTSAVYKQLQYIYIYMAPILTDLLQQVNESPPKRTYFALDPV